LSPAVAGVAAGLAVMALLLVVGLLVCRCRSREEEQEEELEAKQIVQEVGAAPLPLS
jgi:hypothetical protein